jgi:hypothetical protein
VCVFVPIVGTHHTGGSRRVAILSVGQGENGVVILPQILSRFSLGFGLRNF